MRERLRFEREMEELEVAAAPGPSGGAVKPNREVIYVRGATYTDRAGHVRDVPAIYPWRYAHPRGPRTNTALNLFDYELKKHRRWKNWDGALPPKSSPDEEAAISSVLDLYGFVKTLQPETLQELHIFTHGWSGGPIIAGTTQTDAYKIREDARDPADLDARIKDFRIASVLGGAEGARFKKAFAPSALVKLWGCYYEQPYRDKVRKYFKARTKSEKDSIKSAYQSDIENGTYQFAMHRTIGIPVFAAPMGWGTNPNLPFGIHGSAADKFIAEKKMAYKGRWPPRKGEAWWRTSQHFRHDGGFKFYKEVLKADLDRLDYAAYTDALIK